MSLDVRVDKCSIPNAWYKNHIGKTFICESAMSAGGVVLSNRDPILADAQGLEGLVARELYIWFIPYDDCTILNVTGMPPFNQEEFERSRQLLQLAQPAIPFIKR